MAETVGSLFPTEERSIVEVLDGLGDYVLVANDPPLSTVLPTVRRPRRVVVAGDMDRHTLEETATAIADGDGVIVGLGGGTALDTAKFLAWRTSAPLIQLPTITSVDAAFTDAVGLRDEGRVRYVGHITPQLVVLDIPLIRTAPKRLNRAGVGDVLSCHTALEDWRLAAGADLGVPWDEGLAVLGRSLLEELDAAADDINQVTVDGVRFLAGAYRRIGAACSAAGHSRFEEGSEHFWAYCYEHATGVQQIHGELVALGVTMMSVVQDNEPEWVVDVITRCGTAAHPEHLGISRGEVMDTVGDVRRYARDESLDVSIADLVDITVDRAAAAWATAEQLPR